MNTQYPHLLVAKEGPSAGEAYPLEEDEILIGREQGSALQIDSPGVSRKHARLAFQDNQYLIEDLGSSNGTFVNGERISKPRPLKNGDMIGIGRTVQLQYQAVLPPVSATMIESAITDSTKRDGRRTRSSAASVKVIECAMVKTVTILTRFQSAERKWGSLDHSLPVADA